jgi:hypothetical protein
VIITAVACLLLCVSGRPQKPASPSGSIRFDYKAPGSAKGLGVAKLARIQKRSGLTHLSLDQFAKQIETDDDLVSCKGSKSLYRYHAVSSLPQVQLPSYTCHLCVTSAPGLCVQHACIAADCCCRELTVRTTA